MHAVVRAQSTPLRVNNAAAASAARCTAPFTPRNTGREAKMSFAPAFHEDGLFATPPPPAIEAAGDTASVVELTASAVAPRR